MNFSKTSGALYCAILVSFSSFAYAYDQGKLNKGQPCQQQFAPFGTSQNSSDLQGAVTWLNGNISQDLNWCPLQEKIGLKENQAITLLGYELKGGGSREIRYEIDDFANPTAPTGRNCTVQISVIQIPNSLDAVTKTVVKDPVCSAAKPI